jgi:hypothetical protein
MASGVKKNLADLKEKLYKTFNIKKDRSEKYKVETTKETEVTSTAKKVTAGSVHHQKETTGDWTDDLCVLHLVELDEEQSPDWVTNRKWFTEEFHSEAEKKKEF